MARHSRTVGAMHSAAHVTWAQGGSLSIGGNEILGLVAHMPSGTILDILRANGALNVWFVLTVRLRVGALTLHRCDVQRVLTWIASSWFALHALLLGSRGEHLRPCSRACCLDISVQTTTRSFDLGLAGA